MQRWIRFVLATVALAVAACSIASTGWSRYRISVPNEYAAQVLSDSSLRLFDEAVMLGATDVIVGPNDIQELLSLGLRFRWVGSLPSPDSWSSLPRREGGDYRYNYLTYTEILAQYEQWRSANPHSVTRLQIATTLQGRPVYAYRVAGLSRSTLKRPSMSIVVTCGIHAREWIAPSVGMYLFDSLLQKIKASRRHAFANSVCSIYIVPVLNPDGYVYSWTNDRYWRKNRWKDSFGTTYGVDLCRNFPKGWGGSGSSGNKSSDTYRGPSVLSEPESAGVIALADSLKTTEPIVGYFDVHSYGQYILWPWGYTTSLPPDHDTFQTYAVRMRNALQAQSGRVYTIGPTASTLYVASGVTIDTLYSGYNALAYVIELRGGSTGSGFVLPEAEILPTQQETWAAFERFLFDVTGA